ncbi:DUF456 domain-containing protein [Planococcus sp. CAU13]|uniref:DUF456 domain-containing protein n=1 Tax=Planococcus sp. CAU13 TaxID=1541197 RepID=UPI002E0F82C5
MIGPFVGAIGAELIFNRSKFKQAFRSGIGSVVGFITSVFTKGIIQLVMVILFFIVV